MKLSNKIESILFYKNEPLSFSLLAKILQTGEGEIRHAVDELQNEYKDRGIVVIISKEEVALGTHPSLSGLIETLQKEELSRELGRAGLETLAIVLYKGPVTRREIDHIRGVNSTFILRNLLVRGLVERTESQAGERGYSYEPTIKLLEYLGVQNLKGLPDYEEITSKIDDFLKAPMDESKENAE